MRDKEREEGIDNLIKNKNRINNGRDACYRVGVGDSLWVGDTCRRKRGWVGE